MGGSMIMSRTSWAISDWREATTYANFVSCAVIPWVRNCASTWANHLVGSFAQNAGSFKLTAVMGGATKGGLSFDMREYLMDHSRQITSRLPDLKHVGVTNCGDDSFQCAGCDDDASTRTKEISFTFKITWRVVNEVRLMITPSSSLQRLVK